MKNILFPAVISNIMEMMASYSESWFTPVFAGTTAEAGAFVLRTSRESRIIARMGYSGWLDQAFYRSSYDEAHRLWYALGMAAFYEVDHHLYIRLNHVGYILQSGDKIAMILEQLARDFTVKSTSSLGVDGGKFVDVDAAMTNTLSLWYEFAAATRADIEDSEHGFATACWINYETMVDQYYEMLWTLFSPLFTGGQLRGFKMFKGDAVGRRRWWNEFLTMSAYVDGRPVSVISLLEDQLVDLYTGE